MEPEASRHRAVVGLGLLLISLLALAVASMGEQQDEAWIDELTVGHQAGVRLNVNAAPFAESWTDSFLGLGVGTDLHLFGGDLVLHAFPDATSYFWSYANLRKRGTDTSLLHYDVDRLRTIGYLITTYVEKGEYVVWREVVYAVLGSGNKWSIELEWEVDPLLANLAIFDVPVGYRVYRRFIPDNAIGMVCHEDFDDLVLIEEFRVTPGQLEIVFADQGTYGQRDEGRPGIAPPGRVDVDNPLGNLTIGSQLTAGSVRVGSDKSVPSGCLSIERDATVGKDLEVSNSLGVGVAAPGGAGDARFAGSVGIASAPAGGVPLTVGDLGAGATIDLSGGGAPGHLWELSSTRLGDFNILDQGKLRLEIAGQKGDVHLVLGDTSLPLGWASQGIFSVWEAALVPEVARLEIGESSSITVGSDGIPTRVGQPAVKGRLGRFTIRDDASGDRLLVGDDVDVYLGHDTILPPIGGAAAQCIERNSGSLAIYDELGKVDRLVINYDVCGDTAMVIGHPGFAEDLVPPGFKGDVAWKIDAINPQIGTFTLKDANQTLFHDRLRIEASGTYLYLGNPALSDPQSASVIAVPKASGEFVVLDELSAPVVPRFKINTDGKVGIGLNPVGGAAGSLEIACGLGVGMASPANCGDADFAGSLRANAADIAADLTVRGMIATWDLLVMNDADILGNLFVAGNADVDNLDVNNRLDVGEDAAFGGDVDVDGNVNIEHDLNVKGRKFFVQEHPTDPTKEIAYAALEGPEAGTYVRGTACLTDGEAVIELPESFALVTAEESLTVQVTLLEPCNGLYVAEKTTERIVVRELLDGTSDAQFDYLVQGVRVGYEEYDPIRDAGAEGGD